MVEDGTYLESLRGSLVVVSRSPCLDWFKSSDSEQSSATSEATAAAPSTVESVEALTQRSEECTPMTIHELATILTSIDPSPIGDSDLLSEWLPPELLNLFEQRDGDIINRPAKRLYLPGLPMECISTTLRYVAEHPSSATGYLGFALFVVRGEAEDTRWHMHALAKDADGTIRCPSRNPRLRLFVGIQLTDEVVAALPLALAPATKSSSSPKALEEYV
jgi:hypothetical protein